MKTHSGNDSFSNSFVLFAVFFWDFVTFFLLYDKSTHRVNLMSGAV